MKYEIKYISTAEADSSNPSQNMLLKFNVIKHPAHSKNFRQNKLNLIEVECFQLYKQRTILKCNRDTFSGLSNLRIRFVVGIHSGCNLQHASSTRRYYFFVSLPQRFPMPGVTRKSACQRRY